MIDLRRFRRFIAVADTFSFRRAAERLHMAQPPLSAAMRKLEDERASTRCATPRA
ncbi:TPA: LysR family transcriptional regulator, partial [Clostridioides difficile]|nr:LysR family transcriptional regulator [Clostridioides difficile]